MRILIVEDETTLGKTIAEGLQEFGYQTDNSENFNDAEYFIGIRNYDLVLSDLMLPDGDGIDLINVIKQKSPRTSVVIISAKDDKESEIKAFRAGADDYIKKPFELAELMLRIDNILRRKFSHLNNDNYIHIANSIKFDIIQKKLLKDNLPVQLAKKEGDLLALFLKNRGRILSRDEIYMNLWDYGQMPSELSLRVYIRNLRKIIGEDKIVSHPKLGYEYV